MLEAHNGYRTSHATVKIAGSISHLCNGLCMVIYEEIYRKATAKKNTVFFFFFFQEKQGDFRNEGKRRFYKNLHSSKNKMILLLL